jgi:hypothetical protein
MTGFERYAYMRTDKRTWTVYVIGLSGSRLDMVSQHTTEKRAQTAVNRLYDKRDAFIIAQREKGI